MVGGTIIGLVRNPETTLVHVEDKHDTCSIRVIERHNDEPIRLHIGDSIWWQCGKAIWTPSGIAAHGDGCGKTWDIHLPKVGYSH